jgi:sugar (pentulose or hexulose) kinase
MHYKYYFERLDAITGKKMDTVYMVGGGTNNRLLCRFTANAVKKRVLAVCGEAAVAGNALVQLMSANEVGKEKEKNEIIINSFDIREYLPQNTDIWDEAYGDFLNIRNINNQPQRR